MFLRAVELFCMFCILKVRAPEWSFLPRWSLMPLGHGCGVVGGPSKSAPHFGHL